MKVKKIFRAILTSVLACMIMVMSVTSFRGSEVTAFSTQRTYRVYNAATCKHTRTYTLDALPTYNASRDVIGTDDRVVDWSKSGTVKITTTDNMGKYNMGTGFVVGDHVIATAAHCICDTENNISAIISDILLFNSSGEVVEHATPVEIHVPESFFKNEEPKYDPKYDYALITVSEDLSAYNCYYLGVPLDSFLSSESEISVTGFQGNTIYTGKGVIKPNNTASSEYIIGYTADTKGGESGAPVYYTESYGKYEYNTVIGIHTSGNDTCNYGMRMTTDLIDFYNGNPNLNW